MDAMTRREIEANASAQDSASPQASVPSFSPADLESVRAAFDRVAPSFDSVLVRNPINAWMHEANLAVLRSAFPPGSRLLELGCGTGTDALDLARRGCKVLAFDISSGMVEAAREKVAREGRTDDVRVLQGRSRDFLAAARASTWYPFDGAYANFTLTYEPDLRAIAAALAGALRPGALFVCTIPNRVVLSELLLYGPVFRFRNVLWRFATPLLKEVHGSTLEIHAYSPWQVREAFRDGFELRSLVGIPTFLPPVYLHPQYRRLGSAQEILRRMDAALARRFPWNRLGEHTLFLFHRRGGPRARPLGR